jgi:ribosomal protein L11 methyltransferase
VSWVELRLPLARAALETASQALFELGCAGLQEDELEARPPRQAWDAGPEPPPAPRLLVRAWFQDPDRAAIEAALQAALEPCGERPAPEWAETPDLPWEEAWREGLEPLVVREAGAELVVAAPWCAPPGALVIEPGEGFGTGEHPSTRAALRALLLVRDEVRDALDVGTGSGILALAAARLGIAARGVDVEPEAIADARRNAAANSLTVELSTTPVHALREPADLVLANLHAELLVELAPELLRLARRRLILAGILADREARVRAAFDAWGPLRWREADGRWVGLLYSR